MTSSGLIYQYALFAMSLLYVVIVFRFISSAGRLPGRRWITMALAMWPLLVVDEWLKLFALEGVSPVLGLFDVMPALLLTFSYKATGMLVHQAPSSSARQWLPAGVCLLAQSAMIFLPSDTKIQWFSQSPVGQPLALWPAYLAPLATGFAVLLFGILIAECVQRYHHYLPEQVADTATFRIKKLGGVAGMTVGLAFASILLVSAAAFGFLQITFWQSLYHLLMALVCLFMLAVLIMPQRTSPCPVDYQRLEACAESQAEMRNALAKAEQAVIHTKAYKHKGQTLCAFCRDNELDPTLLAITLKLSKYKSFRGFIYHYRLEYAKKVLLRSDASIARVARRLGLDSEKFLSGVLPNYLSKL
ncbi:DNA mismatch repair protein [Alteromonas sp. CYL-A6]|uniref:DNA mismatch repair protein n=1 Tax=Alteromonas nitratireducens TaxID=3390813 RepID=UPI0034BC263C